ncbi:tail completion protein gp17 [Clostridium nigeriense]|uniref:tail completion protein gp17 n=1 Tax=Clostridium nigeriense TaxID=1805470 RepID=UPI003D34B572
MIEKALRYELNKISELENKIFPTNAPEGQKPPYLVYITSKKTSKDLDGVTKDRECYVMLNVLCNSYSQMKYILKKIEDIVVNLPLRNIGEDRLYIQDIDITDISETYEEQLKLQRGIIAFTVYYKEE